MNVFIVNTIDVYPFSKKSDFHELFIKSTNSPSFSKVSIQTKTFTCVKPYNYRTIDSKKINYL